jgi:2-polyprenyl-6-hydroxyphenyl methylase/3-demethylubiquinone-9 3-methyltransferase
LRGRRVLDLGCGKGRFARRLAEAGAIVVGIDLSAAMLAEADAAGFGRVRGSARRLPFGVAAFDAVVAVEVFEHLAAIDAVLGEVRRVLRPGGIVAIVDKNAGALSAERPWLPSALVKRIDERRGLWMYPAGGPVRERWFWPRRLQRRLGRWFEEVRVTHLLSPREAERRLFRWVPRARLLTLWTARAAGRSR